MKKILVFRTDRLGDYIICSRLLYALKKKYGHLTVVCSNINYKLIKNQKYIDDVIIYDKKYSIIKKIVIFFKLFFNLYYLIISLDGKKFSINSSIFLLSKKKLVVVYKKTKKVLNFKLNLYRPPLLYTKLFFNKYVIFNSRDNLIETEHLPSIYSELVKDFIKDDNKKYYLEIDEKSENNFKEKIINYNIKEYILIHFDEKWQDIKGIEEDLFNALIFLSKSLNLKIIISSFNNNFDYYLNLKKSIKNSNQNNLILIENLELNLFERFINYSNLNISCHAGFMVQSTGFNKANCIDILNQNEKLWVSCWIPSNPNYQQIFKNNGDRRYSLIEIFEKIKINYEKKL